MSEKTEDQSSQEPAPIKESDANRVTQEETKRAPGSREDGPAEESGEGES